MTDPTRRPAPVVSPDAEEAAKPATPWRMTVGIHAALLALTVVVVLATVGQDNDGAASASIASPRAAAEQQAFTANETPDPKPHPFVAASLVPSVSASTAHETPPPPTPAAAMLTATPIEAPGLIALPQPGGVWPPTMTRDPATDPFASYGRLYDIPGATRIVYLIDASGSLIDTLPFVQLELQQTLRTLRPQQSFAVIFFNSSRVLEAPPIGMKRASNDAVTITNQWIDPGSGKVIATGRPSPAAAIRRAMAYQPDAVVLLSDGLTGKGSTALAERAQLLTLIAAANTHAAVFHTLQIRQPDPLATATRRGTLELIAMQTGGTHRYVSDADLSRD